MSLLQPKNDEAVSDPIDLLYFSPTGTTRTVLQSIAEGLAAPSVRVHDVTLSSARRVVPQLQEGALLMAAPVYMGRVQSDAARLFRGIRAPREGLPAVVVAVYGNRAFDDALLELSDLATEAGYRVVAAAAFIGEHSFSNDAHPLAPGRPDDADLAIARAFGRSVRDKLEAGTLDVPTVPGSRPYREAHPPPFVPPHTRDGLCTLCGTCASACPTGAVRCDTRVETVAELCIQCAACAKLCPTGARMLDNPTVDKLRAWLADMCPARREPEVFL